MRLFDPFAGLKLSTGSSILHLAYFIAMWMLPDEGCTCEAEGANYYAAKIALYIAHGLVVGCTVLGWIFNVTDVKSLSYSVDWLGIFSY